MEYSFLSFTFDVHMCVFHLANKLCCCWSVSQGASQGRSFLARAFGLARSDVATPLLTGFLLWILCANDVSVELNLTHTLLLLFIGPAEPVHFMNVYKESLISASTTSRINVHSSFDSMVSLSQNVFIGTYANNYVIFVL